MPARTKEFARLSPVVHNTTWGGVEFAYTMPSGSANLASVVMAFGSTEEGPSPDLVLTSAGGDVTIDVAADWEFTVEPITNFGTLAAGRWWWDVWTTDAAGNVKVYVGGQLEVEPSIPIA